MIPVLITIVACDVPPDEFTDVLPDERLILHEEELIAFGAAETRSAWATWLLEEARRTNRRHTELVLMIEAVTVLPARYRDRGSSGAAVWGPWIIDETAERMWVEETQAGHAWAVERQTVDPDRVRFDDDAWVAGLEGSLSEGGGAFVLDVDEIGFGVVGSAADVFGEGSAEASDAVSDEPVGRAALRYAATSEGTALTTFASLDDAVREVPSDGGVTFVHRPGEGGTVTTARVDRDGDGAIDADEVTVRWSAEGGGRADIVIGSEAKVECWGPDHATTFSTDGAGDEAACVFGDPP